MNLMWEWRSGRQEQPETRLLLLLRPQLTLHQPGLGADQYGSAHTPFVCHPAESAGTLGGVNPSPEAENQQLGFVALSLGTHTHDRGSYHKHLLLPHQSPR